MSHEQASLPYAGTSGWSGSDTSEARARRRDASGTTGQNQRMTLAYLAARESQGVTWRELSEVYGWHHGTASSVLSNLHKDGRICRLVKRRDRCKVYVLADFVKGRPVEPHGRKAQPCPNCGVTA